MRRYETIFILDPDLSEEARTQILERTTGMIETAGGQIAKIDEWGNRKLAYPIAKKVRGHYWRLDYLCEGDLIYEMERTFRLDDKVLKFLTVLLDKYSSLEKIEAETAAAEKAAAEAAAALENARDNDDDDDDDDDDDYDKED
ncbi:30S ribosomal protein S6 [Desulfobotulus sp. H1]|uniref:Small ribosomal subunit protein bS6 n=1 Tax=Desulfobotulus pelophilus TaxID=2823377 RepID=A0ABT3N804_9BACT|nr:30S ribosomal protein S6 [Desulfobotulus pelophilus]MCW7753588.1 30S ribosomal protein S6 [Desulfobotulus pelophilus]